MSVVYSVACYDGEERHPWKLMSVPSRSDMALQRTSLDAWPETSCGPHRVVERLTDPEPGVLGAVRALLEIDALEPDQFRTGQTHLTPAFREVNYREVVLHISKIVDAALDAVPEVWREEARKAR